MTDKSSGAALAALLTSVGLVIIGFILTYPLMIIINYVFAPNFLLFVFGVVNRFSRAIPPFTVG